VPQFEVKATSALTGVVEKVLLASPLGARPFFEKLKGTFDICGVDCRVYSKEASKVQKVEEEKPSSDVVQPQASTADESITEHERKRSRVETR